MRRYVFPILLIFSAASILILLFTFANPPTSQQLPVPTPPPVSKTQASPTPTGIEHVLQASDAVPRSPEVLVPVVRVVDGDTIVVSLDGKNETVRLIGINTPETVDPRKSVECFGKEASEKAKTVLQKSSVRLEADPTQGDRDKYGRLLRFVFLPDGTNFNELMIEEGYAYEYTYATPYAYQEEFKIAQAAAMEQKKGLWNEATCNGRQ